MESKDENLLNALERLNIAPKKLEELAKKPQVMQNIREILQKTSNFTKMHYTLACTVPKGMDVCRISSFIDQGLVKHDSMLQGIYKLLEEPRTDEEVAIFVKKHDKSEEAIRNAVMERKGKSKKDLLLDMKNEMPYADSSVVIAIVNETCSEGGSAAVGLVSEDAGKKTDWLEEGEVSRLKAPWENKQATEKILEEHLQRTGRRIVTRFPPEPNGNLHIGHAKAVNFSFEYARKHGGYTFLRYDDTNPKNECDEHFDSILEDVRWLGYEPDVMSSSSDYFDKMTEFSFDLIRKGKGYVCHCTLDDIRNRRRQFQDERDAGNLDPTILSPYRNRTVEENLVEFQKMLDRKYRDGEAVFRFKMDLESKNPLMLDLIGSRIIDMEHPRKGRNFYVYPSYEFALCVSDSLEDVTHSFCSREFYSRQEPYHWLLRNLGIYEPVQWEFSRLNLSNTVLSKRKLTELVNRGMNWDDPRFYTIKGMRRRGFTATAINNFVRSVGITFSETIIDMKILESFVREDLNKIAMRTFCVRAPIKVVINNLAKKGITLPAVTGELSRDEDGIAVDISKGIYIDSADFCENNPPDGFLRLTKTQPVGLIHIGVVKFVEKIGDVITVQLVDEKPEKYIHWVPNLLHKVELRLYQPLFNSFDPEKIGYLNDINFESLKIVDGYCDPRVSGTKPLDKWQFVRFGYFCCDKDSKDKNLVFNLTLPLKSSFN